MGKEAAKNRRFSDEKTERWLLYAGDFPIATSFLASKTYSSGWAVVKFVNALLRGYGHIVFANNPFSGLLIAIALFWADHSAALVGLYSGAVGLVVSILLRLDSAEAVASGATIFNNILFGLVTGSLLPGRYAIALEPRHWFYVTIGAILCVFITSALSTLLASIGKLRLLAFALPFNVVQFILFACVVHMNPVALQSNTTLAEHNVTNTLSPPAQVLSLNLNQRLFQEEDLIHNRSKAIVSATENLELQRSDANASAEGLSRLTLRKVSELNDTQELYGVTEKAETVLDNVAANSGYEPVEDASTDRSKEDLDLVSNTNRSNDKLDLELNYNRMNHSADIDVNTNKSKDESDIVSQSSVIKEEASGFLDEDALSPRLNRTDRLLGWSNNTHGGTKEKREVSDTNEEEGIINNLIDEEALDWGQVFAGIILSMTQAFGFCHVQASLMMYLGILICSPITAAFCITGAVLGTLIGIALSAPPYADVYAGVWGFNGMLSAGALGGFCFVVTWQATATTLACVVFTTLLQKCLMLAFEEANMPVLSLPFNLGAILFLGVASSDARRLPRPDVLSFPEKHLYLFHHQAPQGLQEQDAEYPQSSAKPEKMEEAEETKLKRAPLAEQEVF